MEQDVDTVPRVAPPAAETSPTQRWGEAPWATGIYGLSEDAAIRETLEVLAEDIVAQTGFGAAVLSVRHSQDELKVVVSAGDERVRTTLLGSTMPLHALEALLQIGQTWGNLHFIADASDLAEAVDGRWSWVDEVPSVDPDHGEGVSAKWWTEERWDPENVLLAPLLREDGEVLGLVSVDLPTSGLRPDEAQRLALSVYARQAERTLAAAARRTSENHQLGLAQAARLIVREAGMQHHVSELLPKARDAMLSNFALQEAWIKSTSPVGEPGAVDEDEVTLMAPEAGSPDALPAALLTSLSRAAAHCWREQTVLELSQETRAVTGMEAVELRALLDFLADHDVSTALVVPLGSGATRLGSMILGRSAAGRRWSEAEKSVALDIGHDIGRSIVHTLWFETQQRATEEMRQYADYKRELIMTMSHELQTPLASIRAHAELVKPDVAEDDVVTRSLSAIERGSDRLTKLVSNMLWLARVDDPRRPVETEQVDVVETVRLVVEDASHDDAVHLTESPVPGEAAGGRVLLLEAPDQPVWVSGSESELVLVWCNLVANALKYTDDPGHVSVRVERRPGTVEVVVADDGIGIAPEETDEIFKDFYRSPSPVARQRSGTGLGLAIVRRIVARHNGRITVEGASQPTVFRVALPTCEGPQALEITA